MPPITHIAQPHSMNATKATPIPIRIVLPIFEDLIMESMPITEPTRMRLIGSYKP